MWSIFSPQDTSPKRKGLLGEPFSLGGDGLRKTMSCSKSLYHKAGHWYSTAVYMALSTAPNHITLCPKGKSPLIGVSKGLSWLLLRINARNSHIKKDVVSIKRLY